MRDAVEQEVARGHRLEAGKHPQGGGLAASRRSEHAQEFAILDDEIKVGNGARAVRIGLGDIAEFDARHPITAPRRR